eukprot:348084-Alexandrium_andersonii.AAC.1
MSTTGRMLRGSGRPSVTRSHASLWPSGSIPRPSSRARRPRCSRRSLRPRRPRGPRAQGAGAAGRRAASWRAGRPVARGPVCGVAGPSCG